MYGVFRLSDSVEIIVLCSISFVFIYKIQAIDMSSSKKSGNKKMHVIWMECIYASESCFQIQNATLPEENDLISIERQNAA